MKATLLDVEEHSEFEDILDKIVPKKLSL